MRTFLLIMDSFGIGNADDADTFGDVGSNTLGNIAKACVQGKGDNERRKGKLNIPNLTSLGLAQAYGVNNNNEILDLANDSQKAPHPQAFWGSAKENSKGKDTPSGHWEIAGYPVTFDWGFFPDKEKCFPKKLVDDFIKQTNVTGVLCETHSSGTVVLDKFGEEHMKTGKPILYTSADSVFQIACHEETFGLERLLEICEIARELVDEYNIGRVIARPFVGHKAGSFKRTANRHDYTTPPQEKTVLDILKENNHEVISVGKIKDIFAGCGITQAYKASGLQDLFNETLIQEKATRGQNALIFTNFVDFDMEWGHRRNIGGYAHGLEYFDSRINELVKLMTDDDIMIITADHGCDPTWQGSDHTRENIPVFGIYNKKQLKNIGIRPTFADIGATISTHSQIPQTKFGTSFL